MYYEGTVEVKQDEVNINLRARDPSASEYDIQMNTSSLSSFMGEIKPEFDPDESREDPDAYASELKKQGYGTFYTSDTNINDLVNMYSTTEPKVMSSFPGIEPERNEGDIVFIETIKNFTGFINNKYYENKKIEFRYRGVI